MYKRTDIAKNYAIGNKLDANNPHNYAITQKPYSKKNEYDNFTILNNRKPLKNILCYSNTRLCYINLSMFNLYLLY